MKILRVNMTKLTARVQEMPEKYRAMGGRWLTDRIVCDEVDPLCHPLGPNNKVVFAPGIVTGTPAPSSGRISVGGKSPLTGGIKEANAGTPFAQKLARLGVKAIIVEGKPLKEVRFWLLKIGRDSVGPHSADEWVIKSLYDVFPSIFERFGDGVGVEAIGVAGERLMTNAGVCFNDIDGRPSRYAGRGGLGAVLGSKGLKLIIVDDAGASDVEIVNKELFSKGCAKLENALRNHPITKPGGSLNSYGTAVLVNIMNEAGGYPTRNFHEGRGWHDRPPLPSRMRHTML